MSALTPSCPMPHENRLARFRQNWTLTQAQLGALAGVSEHAVSNYERLVSDPALATIMGFELVFGKPMSAIFPHMAYKVSQRMLNALAELSIEIEGGGDKATRLKQILIDQVSGRIERLFPTL